ncbi:hypothetical protein KDRO_A06930 [Kluyveromyces lactis]|nr:hypothetical protein KDRO_A06930 [Kluyveromyces lactis]
MVGTIEMKKVARSYMGCQKCKSLKKKCDEVKPHCGYCKKRGFQCDYSRTLKWGGRPFKDNRVSKKMKFEHTYVVEGICAVDLNAATGKQATKVKKNKKMLTNKTVVVKEEEPVQEEELQELVQELEKPSLSEPVIEIERVEEEGNSPQRINMALVSSTPLSPLSLSLLDGSKDELDDSIAGSQRISGFHNDDDDLVQSLDLEFFMPSISLPSLMIPDLLLQSPEMAESFDFFVNQTSKLLVPAPSSIYTRNPFFNFLPRMAMSNTALMNLLLVFGANHKHKILQYQELSNGDSSLVANDLLTNTFTNLMGQLTNFDSRNSDSTLATILLLAAFDIFFGDKKQKWRTHVYGARKIMKERISNDTGSVMLSNNSADVEQKYFLLRWFAYTDIISSLSSTNSINNIHKLTSLRYEMETTIKDSLMQKMILLKDIEYFTGMEVTCLWLLAEISRLVNEKETATNNIFPQDLILRALELDHKMVSYLKASELKRNEIFQSYYLSKTDAITTESYDAYRILRATNQIFSLTGVLQLKRRVLGLPPSSPIVIELVKNITELIENWIEFGSSAETCIIFCIFSCGCELMAPELHHYRPLYLQHLLSLIQKGVSSAEQARNIVEECWSSNKQWWDIFKEKSLDVTFAL